MARQLNEAFVEVAESVSPAVVVIQSASKAHPLPSASRRSWRDRLPPEFETFFKNHTADDAEPIYDGRGSGVIVREDGFILTNSHVVEDARQVRVTLRDGRRFSAEVHGIDPLSDIAVLKINADQLPVAKLGDSSKTRVGEFAIAIGAPFQLDYSITFGHVSAKGRTYVVPNLGPGSLGERMDQNFIQTDASINPGNSGGPLVNIEGEVIGINTLIRGGNTGIGFAIPINLAKEVAFHLIEARKFNRAWIGVLIRSVQDFPEIREALEGHSGGVVVMGIDPAGPAAKSELRPADIIMTVEGVPVANTVELRQAVRSKEIGSTLLFSVLRAGQQLEVPVQTAELPGLPNDENLKETRD